MSGRLIVLLLIVGNASVGHSQDWPQFRGPDGQGHSSEEELPLEWSETRNVMWKVPVPGGGWSSPVVADGRIWLTAAIVDQETASLRAIAFDVRNRKGRSSTLKYSGCRTRAF